MSNARPEFPFHCVELIRADKYRNSGIVAAPMHTIIQLIIAHRRICKIMQVRSVINM